MAEELGERTELPTARRRAQARERGQVAKSQDLGAVIDLIGAFVLILAVGTWLVERLTVVTRHLLDAAASGVPLRPADIEATIRWAAIETAIMLAPFLAVMFVVAAISQFVQVGPLLTAEPLNPKLERLNPLAGFKRLFSLRSVVKTAMNSAKLVIVGAVVILWCIAHFQPLVQLPLLGAIAGAAATLDMVRELLLWVLAILVVLGLLDLWYQRHQQTTDLKMTKQEIKDEHRSMEGDPEVKGRRLRMARDIATQRMRQAVPKADVVVTNPTHYAVALRYDPKKMGAPQVVAKGVDFMAFRIREVAALHRVPIVEKPALARALYAGVPVGRQVSPEFYEAVAEILAYVYRLKGKSAA